MAHKSFFFVFFFFFFFVVVVVVCAISIRTMCYDCDLM